MATNTGSSNSSKDTTVLEYAALPGGDRPGTRPLRELLSLALPTVAQMASYTVMQFTDTWMLSMVGDMEATAAGQSGMLSFTIISLGVGVMLVVNTFVSQSFGRGDNAGCGQYMWQGVWTGVLFGVVALPLLPAAGVIFGALGHPEQLAALEADYFEVTVAFSAVKLAAMSLGQFMLAVQRPNTVLFAAVCGAVSNLAFNWLLIFGHWGFPALGVVGAAWGTNAAVLTELLVLAWIVRRPAMAGRFNTLDWRPRLDKLRTLLAVGIPSGVQIVAEVAAWTVFTVWIMAFYGPTVMAANNYMFQFMKISFMPAFGLSSAVTALVGRYIGSGEPDVAARRAHLGFFVTAAYMLACGVLFFFGRYALIGVFTDDAEVLRVGAILLIFATIYQFFDAMYIIYNGALRGAGDTFVPAVVTAALCWTITVGGGYFIAVRYPQWGVAGPWTAASVYGAILSTYLFLRFTGGRWRSIRLDPPRDSDRLPGFEVVPATPQPAAAAAPYAPRQQPET